MRQNAFLIRLMVGAVFLSEGVQKFLFADSLGAGRFTKIGIPYPQLMAPFVGAVEVVAGTLLLLGLLVRFAVLPLLAVIVVAIVTTKIPMFSHEGFWKMAHEGRADFCMLLGLLFLVFASGTK